MRRADRERSDAGGRRGFQVLDPGGSGRYLEPLTPPPPPRAPEPYKVAPPSSSLGRAHRRSSFVIIAETRPATPSSRSPSPTLLATGRVSPFRGRGFKGPLPHAQSRPQSPENHQQNGRRHGRLDRRTSVSQQNSPKRSLIPQPTRRRSVSLTKPNERKPSPKFGRRAAPVARKNSNPSNGGANGGGNIPRRQSLRAPDLSPIQGTPTKPVDASGRVRGGNSLNTKASPVKTRNTLTVPKSVGNARRASQERSPSKVQTKTKRFVEERKTNGENGSPTKIPVRRGSIINKNGSTQSLSTSRNPGKSGKPGKPGERAVKPRNDPAQDSPSKRNENRDLRRPGNGDDRRGDKKESGDPPGSRFIEINSPPESKKREEDLGLIDLLKQTSGATGTSSVVNTTTTTAVQPLQIEAAGILLDNDRARNAEPSSSKNSTPLPSPASRDASPASGLPPSVANESSSLPKTPKATNAHRETGGSDRKPEGRESDVRNSATNPTSSNAGHKNPGKGLPNTADEPTQVANGAGNKRDANTATNSKDKTNKESSNTGATGGSGVVTRKSQLTRNGIQEGSRGEMRVPSANPGSRVNNSNNSSNSNNNGNSNNGGGGGGGGSERNGSGKETNMGKESSETSGKLSGGKVVDPGSSLASGHRKNDSKGSTRSATSNGNGDAAKRTQTRNVGVANAGKIESSASPAVRATGNPQDGKFRGNHGSETSLKSSNGLSTGSVDSIRSTDTGVSVNTVRGVSSAREKKGMHMMKKSEEIETLSGNLMHLERNGEPAVLDITEAPEGTALPEPQTRLGRFKKSLTGLYERLPSMRCLGCRRNQKGHPWPGDRRANQPDQQTELPANGANANAANPGRFHRVWTNLKNACRCMRLRECKCCRRAARVAPAESSTPCCPPERRCGALCRRLFSRCKCCNRSEDQHRRSIRAKHSLTSVAPPPLSEEQRAKIPEVLVEHNSVMRGAIPCLPVPLAWFCLVWNVLIPGTGTVWSGLFNLCIGQPRFAITASPRARFGALVVNAMVGVGQFFTVLFCLVGWGWSIWWGVTMIRLARKYKRFRASEAANGDAEARGGDSTALPPGVPSQALRGMERAR